MEQLSRTAAGYRTFNYYVCLTSLSENVFVSCASVCVCVMTEADAAQGEQGTGSQAD